MILPDVNILLFAFRDGAPEHEPHYRWLKSVLDGAEPFAMSTQVLSAVVRIATHKRIYPEPERPERALGFCNVLLSRPHCHLIQPGPRHWDIFCDLCHKSSARGNLVSDAWFAALAIESGCEWITHDRDYSKFPGLRWRPPF